MHQEGVLLNPGANQDVNKGQHLRQLAGWPWQLQRPAQLQTDQEPPELQVFCARWAPRTVLLPAALPP